MAARIAHLLHGGVALSVGGGNLPPQPLHLRCLGILAVLLHRHVVRQLRLLRVQAPNLLLNYQQLVFN